MSDVKQPSKRVLLISGYDAASHKYWRQSLESGLKDYSWTQVSLPDRYYAWRIRGNGLTLAYQYKDILSKNYDCLIVTSMVDLNSLRGFVPKLAKVPTIVYCHENQFDYPHNEQKLDFANRLNAQLSSIYAMLSANKVLFNSQYNRESYLSGAKKLLKKLPDGVPAGIIENIRSKSSVLAVPIVSPDIKRPLVGKSKQLLEIVWNHRWEFDKQPEVLFSALNELKALGYQFRLHVMGQSFRKIPECFEKASVDLQEEIVTWGYQSLQTYHNILNQADVVISTALHDFQGLSMLEAISRGCHPIAPNRVAYPEYIESTDLYQVDVNLDEGQQLCEKLVEFYQRRDENPTNLKVDYHKKIQEYSTEHLLPQYKTLIDATISIEMSSE